MVVYLPAFYTGTLGLDLAAVGSVFMIVRLLDIAFDPFIGGVMDRVKTRFGRYRPWLAIAAPVIMLSMGMLFMAQKGVGTAYLTFWLLLAYAGWSIMSLASWLSLRTYRPITTNDPGSTAGGRLLSPSAWFAQC